MKLSTYLSKKLMGYAQMGHTPPRIKHLVPLIVSETEEILRVIHTMVVLLTQLHLKVVLYDQSSQTTGFTDFYTINSTPTYLTIHKLLIQK